MMPPPTIFLGRFFGLSCLIMCAALAARPKSSLDAINSMVDSPGLVLVTGIATMFAGVAAVLAHDVWSGGGLPVAVTVLAWAMLIKGVALISTPPRTMARYYRAINNPKRFRIFMALSLAVSAWLTIVAFLT